MIVVTGSVVARQDTFDDVRRLSLEHVHRSRKEPGCISHAVHVDCENGEIGRASCRERVCNDV